MMGKVKVNNVTNAYPKGPIWHIKRVWISDGPGGSAGPVEPWAPAQAARKSAAINAIVSRMIFLRWIKHCPQNVFAKATAGIMDLQIPQMFVLSPQEPK
jgi:hypothetical protein